MNVKPYLYAGSIIGAFAMGIGLWTAGQAAPPSKPKVPVLQVDPNWPKMPLPDSSSPLTKVAYRNLKSTATGKYLPWVTGEVAGTCVDSQDHVFTVNRGNLVSPEGVTGSVPPVPITAVPSPMVIEFDRDGNVANAWDATSVTGFVRQEQIHGCFVDYQDNIWIGGNGDGIVTKYTHDGTLLLQIGTQGVCDWPANGNACGNSGGDASANQSTTLLNEPANVWVDPNPDPVTHQRGSVYIADGYGNHRVVVFSATGQYLRQWGDVAGTVNDPQTDSRGRFAAGDGGHPHCVVGGNDNLIYVCDRADDRIEVFDKVGNLARIINVLPGTGQTLGIGMAPGLGTAGSAWDLRFTNDAFQTYMFEIDGGNEIMHTMLRAGPDTDSIVGGIGEPGHEAGQFTFLHSNTVDSKGNVYTGETINGRRIQKFVHVECNSGKGHGDGRGNCD